MEAQNIAAEIAKRKGMSQKEFTAHCMLNGLSDTTAYKVWGGSLNIQWDTVVKVAQVLDVLPTELFDVS